MRRWLRRNNAWIAFRRAQREGFLTAYRRWRMWRRILDTPPLVTPLEGETEVRLICYFFDYLPAIWTLKSFFRAAGIALPLGIEIQGKAPPRVERALRRHFPQARIVTQTEADRIVEPHLAANGWTRLLEGRRANQYMQKVTDHVILSRCNRLITLDADLLFFRRPEELLDFGGGHLFQRDPESTYIVQEAAGVQIAPRLNVGIMKFTPARISLGRCNDYLADFPTYEGWLDQTLYALHASETGTVNVLPLSYLLSFDRDVNLDSLVVRHYAGPTRHLMTEEGMPWLIRHGFLDGPVIQS